MEATTPAVADDAPLSEQPANTISTEHPIVFFDGVCGLCNHTVDFLMVRDKKGVLRYSPLQGETAAQLLSADEIQSLKSIVLHDQGKAYRRSSAIVRILWKLGGIWKFLGVLCWLAPKPLRDLGYMCLSKTRYKFFGKKEFCRLPSPEERARFLD